jgi:hypothetical protein
MPTYNTPNSTDLKFDIAESTVFKFVLEDAKSEVIRAAKIANVSPTHFSIDDSLCNYKTIDSSRVGICVTKAAEIFGVKGSDNYRYIVSALCEAITSHFSALSSRLDEAKKLWDELGDIPVNEDDEIEERFLHFEAGVDKFTIWSYFERKFDCSVAEDLMFG